MSDLPVANLLSVDQAITLLDAVRLEPRIVRLPLMDATGLLLAEDVFADRDYPSFDKALMDGYAIRAADSVASGARLRVIETVAAGRVGVLAVTTGEAVKIMTGAPLPEGADAVVPVEQTNRDGECVVLFRPVKMGNAIAKRGSDAPANRLLLKKSDRLGPAQMGVAASVGKAVVSVYAAPVVSLLTTGDEIVGVDQSPTGAQIRDSNGPMMTALLQQLGCRVHDLGVVRDDPALIRPAIESGLQSDAMFITGGMSMGEHDYVPMLLRDLGMDLKISKLRIKPGKPFVFATRDRGMGDPARNPSMVFGLPGNPVSAYVCTLRLANRILARLAAQPHQPVLHAKLMHELPPNGARELYLPAVVESGNVTALEPAGSADLFALARANGLLIRSENAPWAAAEEMVRFLETPNK
jgi:molybdopterin molybdotransferase